MENLILGTRAGPFGIVGRLHPGGPRPTLVTLLGAYPAKGQLHETADWFPQANVLVATLPGFDAPSADSPPALLRGGFDELLERLAPGCPLVVFGISAGCLVTLGLRSPNIRRQVAFEPFFETAGLWPLIRMRAELANPPGGEANRQAAREFLWRFFGIGTEEVVNRDYTDLLDAVGAPLDVIVGAEPLQPERTMPTWPSFTSETDRARLRAKPDVTLHQGPPGSGHGFVATDEGKALARRILSAALTDAARRGA